LNATINLKLQHTLFNIVLHLLVA